MRTREDFLKSLGDSRELYYRGERVKSILEHSTLRVAAHHASRLYDLSRSYYDQKLNQEISKYFRIPSDSKDLLDRHYLIYSNTIACNGVFNISQAIGSDALFSLFVISKKIDKKYDTHYFERVQKYHQFAAKNDLALAVAQTDVKGDRGRRPHEQQDADSYLHAVDENQQGIIVRGAKAHTTQSAVSNEIIVLPTRAMTEKDKNYSIAFAIPASAPGLKFIVRPIEELEGNSMAVLSKKDYEFESLTIFDNVLVPWERVFLFREYEFAGPLATTFATYHRFTAVSYRAGTSNLYLGSASLMSKANGISDASHVRESLVNMIMYKELMRMSGIAAAHNPVIEEGIAVPNSLYTNIGKLYSNRNFTDIVASLIDITGGIVTTMPSFEDLQNQEENKYILKYLSGAVSGEERINLLRIVKELVGGSLAGYMLTLMIHAEGSLQASKLSMIRDYDFGECEELIKRILSD